MELDGNVIFACFLKDAITKNLYISFFCYNLQTPNVRSLNYLFHERRNIIVATSNLASVLKSSKKIFPLRRYAITASETNNWHVSTHSCNVINSWSTLFLRTTSANLSYDVVKEK